ncbi:sigma-70 family RNA polymerase sigma factor [Streptomyces sp. NPDC020875]|uniref:RNA polymerase sigma factor n=1 Tax=Streptomyces sp. NPDC020875 TaxID=3154898 RepID=UPI0033FB8D7A
MTSQPTSRPASSVHADDPMPPAFWALHAQYHRPYLEYATVQLGNEEAAHILVDNTFVVLAVMWDHLMTEENPAAYAWALLKTRVADELALQGRAASAATETLAFERAIKAATSPILDDFRTQFRAEYDLAAFEGQVTELADSMRLFAAIARLPERQFDVIVLQYALDFDTETIARVMGMQKSTVRSTRRSARRRLAADLGLPIGNLTDPDEE